MKNTQEAYYNGLYSSHTHTYNDVPDEKINGGIKLKRKKILIYAIGAGSDIKHLLKQNEVWGVDISLSGLRRIEKLGVKSIKADLNGVCKKLPTQYFDVVVAKDIIEHLDNPSNLAKEIYRVLKPSGYAVISVPNHFNLFARLRILFGKNLIWKSLGHDHTKDFEEWNYMHKVYFTWAGFKKFLSFHNLAISKTFWDFGTLAHYSQPELVIKYLQNKKLDSRLIMILSKLWTFYNFVFPLSFRSNLVSVSPSLFCAGFYVWVRRSK